MKFDHECTITRPGSTTGEDEYGQPTSEEADVTIYDGDCQVFEDEQELKRMADSSESLEGKAMVRLARHTTAVIDKTQDVISATYNGRTRTGTIRGTSNLAHYPRLKVEWDD